MATDRIAMLVFPSAGIIATRDEHTLVIGSDVDETVKNMYQTAPDLKVIYIFSKENNSDELDATSLALKKIGYDNVKSVNAMLWFYTDTLHRSQVEVPIGECIAVLTQPSGYRTPISFQIFERTSEGYVRIGSQHSCEWLYFRYCPMLKNILIPNGVPYLSGDEKSLIKRTYPRQDVYFIEEEGHNWLKCMWDKCDGKEDNFLPALLELTLEFKYGNNLHIETIDESDLPFEKVFELDIEDACKLEVTALYYFREHMGPDQTLSSGKSRVLEIVLKVGIDLVPDIDITVVSEEDTIESVVYAIDYKHESKVFTGTLIAADETVVVIDNSDDISEVFKQLDSKKGSAKLRGVFVDYPEHFSFPLDTHRAVINALPSPETKVCVGRVHTEWAIHLRNSGARLQVGEYVFVHDRLVKRDYPVRDVCLLKTIDGFKAVDKRRNDLPASQRTTGIVIGEKKNRLVIGFPFQNVLYSLKPTLPENIRHLFAWEYFTGQNFDDYMVEPYRGVSFDIESGSKRYHTDFNYDYNYGSSECFITCAIKHSDSDSSFIVNMKCIGYPRKCTVLEIPMPKSEYVLLHICVDEHLIPTVTVTETITPLLPEGLATRDKNVIKRLKSTLEKLNDTAEPVEPASEFSSSAIKELDAEKPEQMLDKQLKSISNSLSDVDSIPDLNEVEATQPDNMKVAITSEAAVSDCVSSLNAAILNAPQTVVLKFTRCNRVLIFAGPEYTGDKEFLAYLRLKKTDGKYKFIVGQKAKDALKTHRKSVIYDVAGLLAANSSPKRENAAWTFDTSRTSNSHLLIHLNSKDRTSPAVVLAHIVRAVLRHVNDHLPMKVERVGVRLPSKTLTSIPELFKLSKVLDVEFSIQKRSSCYYW